MKNILSQKDQMINNAMTQPTPIPIAIQKEFSPTKNLRMEEKRKEINNVSPLNVNHSRSQMIGKNYSNLNSKSNKIGQTNVQNENLGYYLEEQKAKILMQPQKTKILNLKTQKNIIESPINKSISNFINNSKIQVVQKRLIPMENNELMISSPSDSPLTNQKSEKIKIVKIPPLLQEKLNQKE